MATGSQIRTLLERTYDNLNPRAVRWLEDMEQSQGFERTKNFMNTLASDYALVPKRGGDNEDFIDVANRVWKKATGEETPVADRLSRVRKSLDKLDDFEENTPATMPQHSGLPVVGGRSGVPAVRSPAEMAGTSNSSAISKSPFAVEPEVLGAELGQSNKAHGKADRIVDADWREVSNNDMTAGGGRRGGGVGGSPELSASTAGDSSHVSKSPFLTAAAAGGAYAVGNALMGDKKTADEAKPEIAPPRERAPPDVSGPVMEDKPGGGGRSSLPSTASVLSGISKYTPDAAPKKEEFGLTNKGADYTKVESERNALDTQYKDARMEYMRQTNVLADELRGEKDSLRRRELFEGIAQALGHLAAGYVAQTTGAYVPVMQFQKSDWAGEKQALLSEYVAKERTAASNYSGYKEQLENSGRSIDRTEAQIVRAWDSNQTLFETALNTWRANEDSKFRGWQSAMEEAKLKLAERGQAEDLAFKYANLGVMRDYYKGLVATASDKNTINAANAKLKEVGQEEKILGNFRKSLTSANKRGISEAETKGHFNQAVGFAQQYKALTGQDLMTEEEIKDADPNPVIDRMIGGAAAQTGTSTPPASGMVTMQLPDGRTGVIPESAIDAFVKANPGAKRADR